MEIILDTNFILECVKNKIDLLEVGEFGELVLPEQVLIELKNLAEGKGREKEQARLALAIIEQNKHNFRMIILEKKFVDAGIIRYVKGKKVIVATLDKGLKSALKGRVRILVIRARKKLEVI